MHLYFVRHGESEANAAGIVAGNSNDSDLTQHGINQAQDAAKWLTENKIKIDAIVSSPAIRAKKTSAIIAHQINYPVKDIVYRQDLAERDCGDYEGGPTDAYQEAPESIAVKEHGVESLEHLYDRVKQAFEDIKAQFANKTVLIVSHNGTGKMLRIVTESRDADEMDKSITLPNSNVSKLL